MNTPLISAAALKSMLEAGRPPVLLDCRFDLGDIAAGERAYAQGRIPGAHYLHLDRDLSGPLHAADGRFLGRHPLPSRERFAALAGALGISPGTSVVAYDAQGGLFAVRAWWLLRWLGHENVALLDGGVPAFVAAGGKTDTAPAARQADAPRYAAAAAPAMPTMEADALGRALGRVGILDARAAPRFRGEFEPIDPIAGHIPGALNRPLQLNLGADGLFKPASVLRQEFEAQLGGRAPGQVVHYCGSGVTACHNIFAMTVAGLPGAVLYPGSWSEWSGDPGRAIARS